MHMRNTERKREKRKKDEKEKRVNSRKMEKDE